MKTLIPYSDVLASVAVAEAYAAAHLYEITKVDGEYRVASPKLDGILEEARAYYTEDLADAVATMKALHSWHWNRAMMQEAGWALPLTLQWDDQVKETYRGK